MSDVSMLTEKISQGDYAALARALTIVESNLDSASALLKNLSFNQNTPILGITGPPGAGKSTLVNALLTSLCERGLKTAVLAIDPTSPFNYGSLLGDRIRMAKHFNHPDVFIRSVANRGSLGGLSAQTIEMSDVLRAANFDLIIVETVGVGQSEVEIAGLASKTLVVLVPESGDEIQRLKSGLMEIAQAFVVNKADREGASSFANKLKTMSSQKAVPVFQTVAEKNEGIAPLLDWILNKETEATNKKDFLLAEQAYRLIQYRRMTDIDKSALLSLIKEQRQQADFNIYRFIEKYV